MLMEGYNINGDDFPSKLHKAMELLSIVGEYRRGILAFNLDDPFITNINSAPAYDHSVDQDMHRFMIELARSLTPHTHHLCFAAAFNFDEGVHSSLPDHYDNRTIRIYDILVKAYEKFTLGDFMRIIVNDIHSEVQVVEIMSSIPFSDNLKMSCLEDM
jgi:hypothetical protein